MFVGNFPGIVYLNKYKSDVGPYLSNPIFNSGPEIRLESNNGNIPENIYFCILIYSMLQLF